MTFRPYIVGLGSLFCSFVVGAAPSAWSLGAGAAYAPAVYKDTPSNKTLIPIVNYEGEQFFVRNFSAGYRIFPQQSEHNLVLRLHYDPRSFKPSKSDDIQMQGLDRRRATVLTGISYQYNMPLGQWETSLGVDALGRHNGLYAETTWRYPILFKQWGVTPSIGYQYNSSKMNDYLYGVSAAESARTGIKEYDVGWDGEFFVGATGYWAVRSNLYLTGALRYSHLDNDIVNSPIVGRKESLTTMVGASYFF